MKNNKMDELIGKQTALTTQPTTQDASLALIQARSYFADEDRDPEGFYSGPGRPSYEPICTIMGKPLIRFEYTEAVLTYLACGIFLCEKFGENQVKWLSEELNWNISTLYVHAEDEDIVDMSIFLRWVPYFHKVFLPSQPQMFFLRPRLSAEMLNVLLKELNNKIRSTKPRHKNERIDNRLIRSRELAKVATSPKKRQELVEEFHALILGKMVGAD